MFAAIGIVLLTGGATYAVARNEVSKVVEALEQHKPVELGPRVLAPTSKGAPETLLLVGNDERPPPKDNPGGAVLPHSNEMLLVRIDPSKPTISMLSIPRELQVTFTKPNGELETNRINSAYTYGYENGGGTSGGVKLMLETIKKVFGLTVNHVFVTNFKRFKRAVDEMGCVYMTVDKRYYHVNEPEGEQYFEINLQPGYQRLCGQQALEFVANRHESTSLIRDARDQRFLLEVKAEYGPTLFESREKFERILGKAMETDLHGEEQILQLLELLVESAGRPVRQVPFHVTLLPTVDTATPEQIGEAVRLFLNGTAPISTRKVSRAVGAARSHHRAHASAPALALTATTAEELANARSAAPELPFALEYPRVRNTNAEAEPDTLRLYHVHDQHGHLHPIYVIVIDRGGLGEYYDVQGSAWTDPPLLSPPAKPSRSARARTACTTRAKRSGRSHGTKVAPSTGSRTPSQTASSRTRCWRWPSRPCPLTASDPKPRRKVGRSPACARSSSRRARSPARASARSSPPRSASLASRWSHCSPCSCSFADAS